MHAMQPTTIPQNQESTMTYKFSLPTLVLALVCVEHQLFAALPPLYQSKKEIEAILADPQFGERLSSGDRIEEITKTTSGYLIVTNHRILQVDVHYKGGKHIGPASFTLEFQTPIDTKE